MANKDVINKLHVERISMLKQEIIKLKEESKKRQIELKQVKIELEEARASAISLVEENSEAAVK